MGTLQMTSAIRRIVKVNVGVEIVVQKVEEFLFQLEIKIGWVMRWLITHGSFRWLTRNGLGDRRNDSCRSKSGLYDVGTAQTLIF